MPHFSFNNTWIRMKFGIEVEGLNTFILSSDRLFDNQNGRHYEVITRIHRISHKYNSVNNAWIHLKFDLCIVYVNVVI